MFNEQKTQHEKQQKQSSQCNKSDILDHNNKSDKTLKSM